MKTITAKFNSKCAGSGQPIKKGQTIIYDPTIKALQDLVKWIENKEPNESPGFSFNQAKEIIKKATNNTNEKTESAPNLLKALQTIQARIRGEFDHPGVLELGILNYDPIDDINIILSSVL